MQYKDPDVYRTLAGIQKEQKDTTAALKTLEAGKARFPGNNAITLDELNIYLSRGQTVQIIDKLKNAVASDPTNKSLHFALGTTYDNLKKYPEAEASYKKAIELDANYFDANYNLGALYFNQAVEIFNAANQLPPSKQKEYEAGVAKSKEQFNNALPVLEKALSLEPNDRNTMIALKEIYARTGNNAKADEMKAKMSGK